MIVILCGKREDYDIALLRRVALLLKATGYVELWVAKP